MATDHRILLQDVVPNLGETISKGLGDISKNRRLDKQTRIENERIDAKNDENRDAEKFLTTLAPITDPEERAKAIDASDFSAEDKEALHEAAKKDVFWGAMTEQANRALGIESEDLGRARLEEQRLKRIQDAQTAKDRIEERKEQRRTEAKRQGDIARAKAEVDLAMDPRIKFATNSAASAVKKIDDSIIEVNKIGGNLGNLDRAIDALRRGADTGTISRHLPSWTKATKDLMQIQKKLGLDVVGSAKFGALSAGELDLALSTALDLSQEPKDLLANLMERREKQAKLMDYIKRQIRWLDQPNEDGSIRSPAQWIDMNESATFEQGEKDNETIEALEAKARAQGLIQ